MQLEVINYQFGILWMHKKKRWLQKTFDTDDLSESLFSIFPSTLDLWMQEDLPFPGPLSSPLTELQRKEELSEEQVQTHKKKLLYWCYFTLLTPIRVLFSHLDLRGVELLGETGDTGGRPSPSQELVVAALLLAQAFSLGGGAGITFKGSLDEPEGGGIGEFPGEEGSPSLPLNTSFSPERSTSRHREPIKWNADRVLLMYHSFLDFMLLVSKAQMGNSLTSKKYSAKLVVLVLACTCVNGRTILTPCRSTSLLWGLTSCARSLSIRVLTPAWVSEKIRKKSLSRHVTNTHQQ